MIDNILFTCSVGIPTYAPRLPAKRKIAPTLAMGLTVNHIAAVTVPVTAPLCLGDAGIRTIFWGGVAWRWCRCFDCRWLPERPGGSSDGRR